MAIYTVSIIEQAAVEYRLEATSAEEARRLWLAGNGRRVRALPLDPYVCDILPAGGGYPGQNTSSTKGNDQPVTQGNPG